MENTGYKQITQDEAKAMMDADPDIIILDVREEIEYDEEHIKNAQLLPLGSIDKIEAAKIIPEKDSTVLVYCRSGRRSKMAAEILAKLGYSNIYEFGGILTWEYDLE